MREFAGCLITRYQLTTRFCWQNPDFIHPHARFIQEVETHDALGSTSSSRGLLPVKDMETIPCTCKAFRSRGLLPVVHLLLDLVYPDEPMTRCEGLLHALKMNILVPNHSPTRPIVTGSGTRC